MLSKMSLKAIPVILACVSAQAFAYDFSQADALFALRGEGDFNQKVQAISQARAAYRAAIGVVSGVEKVKTFEMLARLDYYEGMINTEASAQKPIFERCMKEIESIKPGGDVANNPEYFYWKATCIASWGKATGVLAALFKSKELVDTLDAGRAVARTYEGGGFDRIAAPVFLRLPGFNPAGPTGSVSKASDHVDAAIASSAYPGAKDPDTSSGDYFYNVFEYKAEILVAQGKKPEAIALLETAISRIVDDKDLPVGREPETMQHLNGLQELLAKLKG